MSRKEACHVRSKLKSTVSFMTFQNNPTATAVSPTFVYDSHGKFKDFLFDDSANIFMFC